MKKLFLYSWLFVFNVSFICAQTISNAEKFSLGTVLKFIHCDSAGVYAGNTGNAVTWNFSGLKPFPYDTETEWMVTPASTTHGSDFPGSTQVEKYSNGQFVYVYKTSGASYLVGFVDTTDNLIIKYPDSIIFALRPISYGNSVTDTFTDKFSSGADNFSGGGPVTINADGYGTLILPTGTYNNVLRVKITQVETDTLLNFKTTSVTTSVSNVWFDGVHTSALLKIDSSNSASGIQKTVQYLVSETTGTEELKMDNGQWTIFPNPTKGKFAIQSSIINLHSSDEKTEITIYNIFGQQVFSQYSVPKSQYLIDLSGQPGGLYFYRVLNNEDSQIAFGQFVIE